MGTGLPRSAQEGSWGPTESIGRAPTGSGRVVSGEFVGLVVDVAGDLTQLVAVLAGVVGAEKKLPTCLQLHAQVSLSAASVATINRGQRSRALGCGCAHGVPPSTGSVPEQRRMRPEDSRTHRLLLDTLIKPSGAKLCLVFPSAGTVRLKRSPFGSVQHMRRTQFVIECRRAGSESHPGGVGGAR